MYLWDFGLNPGAQANVNVFLPEPSPLQPAADKPKASNNEHP